MPSIRKSYTFTLNNYSDEEYESLVGDLNDEVTYAVVGKEVGESGTPHLQGYVLFRRSYHFNTIKNRFFPRAHIEVAAGSVDANFRYCSKDGDFIEIGTRPSHKRTRDELAVEFSSKLQSGHNGLDQFANEYPGVYMFTGHNMLRNYQALRRPIERPNINVRWFYGKPGTGKSRKAHEEFKEAYIKDPRTKWWNGYMFEEEVIIDDFGPNGIDINHLLRWFDRYKCIVENKGGMIPLIASSFIVTSNFHPCKIFTGFGGEDHPQLDALMRRIVLVEF
jgi:hypothetical protein